MDEEVDFQTLYNCTSLVLGPDTIAGFNRSELLNAVGIAATKNSSARSTLRKCLLTEPLTSYIPWWQKLLWIVLFSSMVIVATTGNAIVMWIVLAHRRMRTVTNYFLVNLSVSDLLMSLFNCIFNFTFMLDSHWPFGAVYCTFNNFVANVSVAASVFTLVAISLDRYMAIVRPLKHRISRRKAGFALAVIWLASCLLALPCLLYSTTMQMYQNGQIKTVCYLRWPDGHYPKSMSEHVYNLVFLAVTYLGPVIAMAICYTLMGRELWGSKSIGEQTQRQLDNIRSKRKVVRMFITVISIFTICWLPYHGYFIYVYHNKSIAMSSYVHHIYLFFYWLAMSNSMVNPIIYYWMNHRFRVYFRQIICCCCCMRHSENTELQSITNKRQPRSELILRSKSCKLQGPCTEVDLSCGGISGDLSGESSSTVHVETIRVRVDKQSRQKNKQFVDSRYD
ncbi:tachykinin-like peptides receptor 86C isoform X2 [Cimex lectularius]|uniref:G-protein coupled receptors family 1 profile domain-containing protein n=1 Tax=Cimex lectularius TaxID=79782 RepID=A0A8I6TDJ2_CIMLE|nr:tachykinin-like peptides receptor 86C isoform X2 [Cimex lectularius]